MAHDGKPLTKLLGQTGFAVRTNGFYPNSLTLQSRAGHSCDSEETRPILESRATVLQYPLAKAVFAVGRSTALGNKIFSHPTGSRIVVGTAAAGYDCGIVET